MNIAIIGYYGFGNAGDELILDMLVTGIRTHLRAASITVLSAKPETTASLFKVNAVNRWNPVAVLRALRSCDLFITGGGGLFQDRTSSLSLYYYLGLIQLAAWLGKKVFVYAVGVHDLKRMNRMVAARVLNKVDAITVRERGSYALLTSWGCSAPKLEISTDPVLGHTVTPRQFGTNPVIAFVLRPRDRKIWGPGSLAACADALIQRLSARVVFVPFQQETDLAYTREVMASMRAEAQLSLWKDPRELYELFSGFDMVISQRLHALILAALYCVPAVGILKDAKMARFMQELGQKNLLHLQEQKQHMNPYDLVAVMADLWEWRQENRPSAQRILQSFKLRAYKNTELLLRYREAGSAWIDTDTAPRR